LGFKDDFKMLIQNGFIRKYIFFATVAMSLFISTLMALIDTTVGQGLHYFFGDYHSLFGLIYGYGNPLANWLWLTCLYMIIISLFCLGVLIINKIGKTLSIYLGILLGGLVLIILSLVKYVLSAEVVHSLITTLTKMAGFMADGKINFLFPSLTALLLVSILLTGAYIILKHTELH